MADPIEGFHFVNYDGETKNLTIAIDRAITGDRTQEDPIVKRMIEILAYGKEVSKVTIVDR